MAFGIKDGYRENPGPVYFLDDVTSTRGVVFQPDVYTLAAFLADLAESRLCATYAGSVPRVVDVGCGWGDKLAAMHAAHPHWHFVGIDFGANIAHCREQHPWGTWIEQDLERGFDLAEAADVVICSDVIEHLVDPTALLASLRAMQPKWAEMLIVLSTPERDMQWGHDHRGPSNNLCHVREWNAEELNAFLVSQGFEVLHHGLTRGSDQGWSMATQLVVCR